jgi:TatA/E family protein of Tat protein translocase
MFGSLGAVELLVIAALVMLVFGPSQLPKLGRSMGETIRAFRGIGRELSDTKDDLDAAERDVNRSIRDVTRPK